MRMATFTYDFSSAAKEEFVIDEEEVEFVLDNLPSVVFLLEPMLGRVSCD